MATRKKRCGFFSNLQNPATACKRLASRLQIALTAHLVHTPRKPQSPRAVSRVPESHTGCLCLAASCRHRQAPSSRDVLLALHHVSQRVHCPCSLPPSNKDVPCLFSSPCTLRLLWSCHDGNTISSTMTFGDRQARATRIRNSRDPNAPRARVRDFNEILAGRCDSRVAMLKSKVPRLRRGPQLFSKAISAVRACCLIRCFRNWQFDAASAWQSHMHRQRRKAQLPTPYAIRNRDWTARIGELQRELRERGTACRRRETNLLVQGQ